MVAKNRAWLLVVALVVVIGGLAAVAYQVFLARGEVRVIPMAEALERINGGEKVVLLDVRTPEEHAAGYLPGSLLLTLDVAGGFGDRVEALVPDKSATVFVYCRSGSRSQSASEIMAGLGYTGVHNIGGMNDVSEGVAVVD